MAKRLMRGPSASTHTELGTCARAGCKPIDSETLSGPVEVRVPNDRYGRTELHTDDTPCNDTECERWHRQPDDQDQEGWRKAVDSVNSPKVTVPADEAKSPYDPPPTHYAANGMQPWDIIDAYKLDYYAGNVLKYLLRAGKKDIAPKLDDLKKARNCLARLIEQEERSG